MKILKIIGVLACLVLAISASATASTINRNILAVYDGDEVLEGNLNRVYQYAAMPLEHLGFVVDYVDVSKRLPDDSEMAKYRGVISWFADSQLKDAANYGRWLTKQVKTGKKLLAINNLGFYFDEEGRPVPEDVWNDFFQAFGIKFLPGKPINSPLLINMVQNDPSMTEFERKLGNDLTFFEDITAPGAQVYLKLQRKDTGSFFDAVFINSKGGAALGPYALYYNPANEQTRWRINPFKFFAEVLGSDFPKPDVSTMNGMRLFYSHIDGDGLRNESKVFKEHSCGEIAYDQIFLKYKLPITASVIVGDIFLTSDKKRRELVETLRKMYRLPNIDAASHGWSHPAEWKEHKPMLDLRGYTYSPENEIGKSIAYINEHFVPENKKTNLFLWTGDCEPDYEALKYVHDNGLKNINGGNTRFDKMFPSYSYVAPLFRMEGGLTQVLTSDANEYIYTDNWKGPFYGYKHVIQTFENTDKPMRLRPINVYYNFYSLERGSSIKSLNDVYEFALEQEIYPVFTVDYVDIANGFRTTAIDQASSNSWIISDNDALRTIRFDNESRYVDLTASKGVLGFKHMQGSLYVHLEGRDGAKIFLTDARPSAPYISKANGEIDEWKSESNKTSFTINAIGRVHFVLGGMNAGRTYIVSARDERYKVKSDKDGFLTFYIELPSRSYEDVEMTIQ